MAEEIIVWKPLDIRSEIEALGLDFEGLIDCVRYAERERSFVTANDAIGFGSLVVYDKAGRALRETYVGRDWVKDDSNNQCAIKNPVTRIRVVPCNFDEFAGNRLVTPTNRSPKGSVSRHKSMCNRTGWLPGIPKGNAPLDDGYLTWLLGIFADGESPTRAELSLPIDFDGNQFTDFGKRIMLISGDGDGAPEKHVDDIVEVTDITIRRK